MFVLGRTRHVHCVLIKLVVASKYFAIFVKFAWHDQGSDLYFWMVYSEIETFGPSEVKKQRKIGTRDVIYVYTVGEYRSDCCIATQEMTTKGQAIIKQSSNLCQQAK